MKNYLCENTNIQLLSASENTEFTKWGVTINVECPESLMVFNY